MELNEKTLEYDSLQDLFDSQSKNIQELTSQSNELKAEKLQLEAKLEEKDKEILHLNENIELINTELKSAKKEAFELSNQEISSNTEIQRNVSLIEDIRGLFEETSAADKRFQSTKKQT